MDIIKYTDDEIAKNFALLENHLKQAQSGVDEIFCEDCINKHLVLLEGLSEEGMNAGGSDIEKYKKVYGFVKGIKNKNFKRKGINLSDKARQIRKNYFSKECPTCKINSPKDLNNPPTYDNYIHNSKSHINDYDQLNGENNKMPKINLMELGMYNVGQFAAEGVRYLSETQFPAQAKWVNLGGGVVLQILPMFVKKIPKGVKTMLMVAGSNLLAAEIIKMIKGTSGGSARAVVRANSVNNSNPVGKFTGRPNGRVFGGRVTATNIPTQYARAGILGGAQAFEAPEHADLIRVD